jgi:hypothetical protein
VGRERDEDTSKVPTIGDSQDESGPCKDVIKVGHKRFPIAARPRPNP